MNITIVYEQKLQVMTMLVIAGANHALIINSKVIVTIFKPWSSLFHTMIEKNLITPRTLHVFLVNERPILTKCNSHFKVSIIVHLNNNIYSPKKNSKNTFTELFSFYR